MTNCESIYRNLRSAISQVESEGNSPHYTFKLNYYPPFEQVYSDGFVERHPEYTELSIYHKPTDRVKLFQFNSNDAILSIAEALGEYRAYKLALEGMMRDTLLRGE